MCTAEASLAMPGLERSEEQSGRAPGMSLGLLQALACTIVDRESLQAVEEPGAALAEALLSPGPHPELAGHRDLFGRLVGTWDLEITSYPENGEPLHHGGEWIFAWALEGRAIVDVWISPRRGERGAQPHPGGDYGMAVRFYDPSIEAWRSTWIGPMHGLVRPFIARECADGIVLEGSFSPGVDTRWMFSAIRDDSFRWRSVQSRDGWKTERLWQEMLASRVA